MLWSLIPRAALIVVAGLLLASPIAANDSEAEIALGGIVLKPSTDLRLVSEDLFLSEEKVTVDYVFENPTNRTITTTIAFPMPGQPRGLLDTHYAYGEQREDWSGFDFATRIDGRPVRLQQWDRAMIGARDVTDEVIALGLPVYWTDTDEGNPFARISEARTAEALSHGLALRDDPRFPERVVPAWEGVTYFVREQVFPASSRIRVQHEYVPMVGGSVGGALYPNVRNDSDYNALDDYRERYCVDDYFLAGVDRRLAAVSAPGRQGWMSETWLGYVLSSGANWQGPIERFRLVVDKGSTDNLVSFCMDGVEKIGPTRFEVVKTNFEPTRDLDILIVKFVSYEN